MEDVKCEQQSNKIAQNAANAKSIPEFATDQLFGFSSVNLKFHYRSMSPELMCFNAAAIYKDLSLCPGKPISSVRPPIRVTRVKGIYNNLSNQVEAEKILRILKEHVNDLEDQSAIAIATFNEKQQKLILILLKGHPDQQFILSIRELQSQNRFL